MHNKTASPGRQNDGEETERESERVITHFYHRPLTENGLVTTCTTCKLVALEPFKYATTDELEWLFRIYISDAHEAPIRVARNYLEQRAFDQIKAWADATREVQRLGESVIADLIEAAELVEATKRLSAQQRAASIDARE